MKLSISYARHSLLLTSALILFIGLPATLIPRRSGDRSNSDKLAPTSSSAVDTYGQIPLSFEANKGQTDGSVNFLARGAGYALFLKPTEAVFVLRKSDFGMRNEA